MNMKKIVYITTLLLTTIIISACDKNDDNDVEWKPNDGITQWSKAHNIAIKSVTCAETYSKEVGGWIHRCSVMTNHGLIKMTCMDYYKNCWQGE